MAQDKPAPTPPEPAADSPNDPLSHGISRTNTHMAGTKIGRLPDDKVPGEYDPAQDPRPGESSPAPSP